MYHHVIPSAIPTGITVSLAGRGKDLRCDEPGQRKEQLLRERNEKNDHKGDSNSHRKEERKNPPCPGREWGNLG